MARLVGIGLAAGVFSSLFGVGGGILIVPLLTLIAAYPVREAAATSLGAIGITAAAGVVLYALRGEVDAGYALLVGVPGAVGAVFGAGLQQRVSGRSLTVAFAALVAGLGIWLIAG